MRLLDCTHTSTHAISGQFEVDFQVKLHPHSKLVAVCFYLQKAGQLWSCKKIKSLQRVCIMWGTPLVCSLKPSALGWSTVGKWQMGAWSMDPSGWTTWGELNIRWSTTNFGMELARVLNARLPFWNIWFLQWNYVSLKRKGHADNHMSHSWPSVVCVCVCV